MKFWKIAIWVVVAGLTIAAATVIIVRATRWRPRSITIQGAAIRNDDDVRKQSPIADAAVTVRDGVNSVSARSDASGYFQVKFPAAPWPGQVLTLQLMHEDYEPYELKITTGLRLASKELYVAAMTPNAEPEKERSRVPATVVTNIRVRYTLNSQVDENIGSAVRTFQVVNKGNVPCRRQNPCSPDGAWKAASGSVTLDAGQGNEFRNVRASCIAGPCAFTRIDSSDITNNGRTLVATGLDWSDTATFLLEAEVFRTGMTSHVRQLYPVLFGQALHFTLPPSEEGVSLEADVNGAPMVFPLGPELYLSWATCTMRDSTDGEKTQVYRCELKSGYSFERGSIKVSSDKR